MKKVFTMIAVAAMATAFVACGPSKEELEKIEQKKQDSIAAIERQRQDSLANALQEQERLAQEAAKRVQDSTRIADSTAAATKGGKKK